MNTLDNSQQEIIKITEQSALFNLFYPRAYNNTSQYHSVKWLVSLLVQWLAEYTNYQFGDGDRERLSPTAEIMSSVFNSLVEKKMPSIFIAKPLLEAVRSTNFDMEINWRTIPLPYEHGIFILPKGNNIHYYYSDAEASRMEAKMPGFTKSNELAYIIWARLAEGEYQLPTPSGMAAEPWLKHRILIPAGGAFTTIYTFKSGRTSCISMGGTASESFRISDADLHTEAVINGELTKLDEKGTKQSQELERVFFGTVFAISARPALLTKGTSTSQKKRSDGTTLSFWNPNIVGDHYQIRQPVTVPGSHNPPRLHWRRGHFRNQAIGAGRKEHKIIWLEPMLVGAE